MQALRAYMPRDFRWETDIIIHQMTYDDMKLRDDQLLDTLLGARKVGMTTMMHAENGDIINWLTGR